MINRFRFLNGDNEEETINLLERTLKQRKDILLLRRCINKLGLKLKRFLTNDKLELYFDVYRNRKNICYISKGWGDPGFRIGELVELNKASPNFKENFYEIFKICSRNLISIGLFEQGKNKIEISLEIGIFQHGFNEKVLKETIRTMGDTMRRIGIFLTK
jgi:hypothetical protein